MENKKIYEKLAEIDVKKLYEDRHVEIKEMAQIKCFQDINFLLLGDDGVSCDDLPASKYHHLMRNYRFALSEANRYRREVEKHKRDFAKLKKIQASEELTRKWEKKEKNYIDLAIEEKEDLIKYNEVELENQKTRIVGYEEKREELIKANGGKLFTNEQYNNESKEYFQKLVCKNTFLDFYSNRYGLSKGNVRSSLYLQRETGNPALGTPIDEVINFKNFLTKRGPQINLETVLRGTFPKEVVDEMISLADKERMFLENNDNAKKELNLLKEKKEKVLPKDGDS